MSSFTFNEKRIAFIEYYEHNIVLWRDAVSSLITLLQLLLRDQKDFFSPQVIGRIKLRDECIAKFSRKYQLDLEKNQTNYEIKDYISDIVGLRVICLYETDIPYIRSIIEQEFNIENVTNKSASIESHDDTFGYKGLHLDLKLKQPRANLPEYSRFKDLKFELQIRTIVQDAWSVIDHKIKYKKNIPDILRRRINRLAALFELSDQEFVNIRDETHRFESASVTDDENINHKVDLKSNRLLDAFGFSQIMKTIFPNYIFDGFKIDNFVDEIKNLIQPLCTESA